MTLILVYYAAPAGFAGLSRSTKAFPNSMSHFPAFPRSYEWRTTGAGTAGERIEAWRSSG